MKSFPLALGAACLLASAAVAQTTTATGTTMGQEWDQPMIDSFFTPGGSMTLRPEGEVRTSWESLSDEQKQQVRDDCASFGTDTAAQEAGDAGAALGADGASTGAAGDVADAVTSGAPEVPEDIGAPAMQGTGTTTNADAEGATTGSGDGSAGTATNSTGEAGSGEGSFDPATVSLTSWTQICSMVDTM